MTKEKSNLNTEKKCFSCKIDPEANHPQNAPFAHFKIVDY